MTQGITSTGQGCRPWPAQRFAISALLRRTTWQTRLVKSSLPACPVLLRCRSARKLFLPDLLRRMASSWCAHIMAALLRKSIVACSRSCCCQGTMLFCKKSRAFKNASKTVFESSPYTLYKLKGVFLNGVLWKFGKFSLFQTTSYTYNILKRVFGNLIFKFCLENFLHQYESIGPFWNTILDKKKNGKVHNRTLPFWGMLHSSTVLFLLVYYFITAFSNVW